MAVSRLVLASSSPWRLQLLRDAGVPCLALPPMVDEGAVQHPDPATLALRRAQAKAGDVARRHAGELLPGDLVLGADQVAWMGGEVFGKPADITAWRARLRALVGRTHRLTTGVALVVPGGREVDAFVVTTVVRFRGDLAPAELDAYVATGEALGCAGGYMAERRGAWLIESIDGDWLNVVGLPVFALLGRLRALGWQLQIGAEVHP